MKKIAAILVVFALLSGISSAARAVTATKDAQTSGGHVYVVSGTVSVAQGKSPAHQVVDNEAIVSDTLLTTGEKSAALLKFEDGQVVTMQANSVLHVREYRYDARRIENSSVVLSMLKGGMRFITGLIGQRKKQAFRLLTPNATIGIRGTEFMVIMSGKAMYSQVLRGKVAVTNAAGSVVLGAGQTAVVASTGALASAVATSAIPSGAFSELISIPVSPSAIPAPASSGAATGAAGAGVGGVGSAGAVASGAAGSVGGTAVGLVGGALAGLVGGDSEQTSEEAPEKTPDTTPLASETPPEPPEPAKMSDTMEMNKDSKSGIGLTGKIGTLGYGAELSFGFTDRIATRIGLNAYTYKRNADSGTVNYDFKLQLQTASVLADWYPFAGSFRTSGGVFYNKNKFGLDAKPTGGSYTINGATYSTTQISSLQGTLSFNKVAPYFGIGWGNPVAKDKGWGMTSDFGVLFQGKPKTGLVATCGGGACSTAIQDSVTAENTKLQNDLSNFKLWPVVSFGISYQW